MKKSLDGQTPHALIIRRQRQVPRFSSGWQRLLRHRNCSGQASRSQENAQRNQWVKEPEIRAKSLSVNANFAEA
jgi:hypothetical protein